MSVAPSDTVHPRLRLRRLRLILLGLLALVLLVVATVLAVEARTSWFQAREIARFAASLDYTLQAGASGAVRFPQHGPFDVRMGYAQLPRFTERLGERGFAVTRQARFSDALMDYTGRGLFPPYREKNRAGLELAGHRGEPMYATRYPLRGYAAFDEIPPLIVNSLLFIENRELLDTERPHMNPAVDWVRFGRALFAQLAKRLDEDLDQPGGSTLATQIEKYRHSPGGITSSPREKLRQMVSASVRAYRDGRNTLPARQGLVLDYLNTVPLSAAPMYGEVNGLGDGLWVWYGADFARVNELLAMPEGEGELLAAQGRALRQVLSLMIAHRRPSWYLGRGREVLARLTDSHLRLITQAGLISPRLRDAALGAGAGFRDTRTDPAYLPADADKGTALIRSRLAGMLGVSQYELDRLDLQVQAALDQRLQRAVSDYLGSLYEPGAARAAGIVGDRMPGPDALAALRYSFTLFERRDGANRVRVQTDTTDQPLDINEGSKLELGSTAKLRVLATYLEIVAELHERYAAEPAEALRKLEAEAQDAISRWAIGHLAAAEDRGLVPMLEAALERRYSANPGQAFFTGGGLHTFNNFRREDDGRNPTLRESLQASINLPFVRLMRDIVRYTMYQMPGSSATLLEDAEDPRRLEYLARFADREGRVFLRRFWRKYQGQTPEQMRVTLLDGLRPSADRLGAVFRYLDPEADVEAFGAFLAERLGDELPAARVAALYKRYAPGSFDLPDQGYIARVHPLELWLVGYLMAHPQASFAEAVEAGGEERQAVYRWLFRTRAKDAQDQRIHTMLEVEAFLDIHRRWARLGYPFPHLVPSLATALGSSGDRPAALAELMGIIVNDGRRLSTVRIENLRFAAGTPYETEFGRSIAEGEQVMAPEVARALRGALSEVVEGGTARRLAGSFVAPDGTPLVLGGKTGTGDNRIVLSGARRSIALNRTATFVFYLGPRHFGTLTAYVIGPDAASFRFTSALPVQILKSMAPILSPYVAAAAVEEEAPAREAPKTIEAGVPAEAPTAAELAPPDPQPAMEPAPAAD